MAAAKVAAPEAVATAVEEPEEPVGEAPLDPESTPEPEGDAAVAAADTTATAAKAVVLLESLSVNGPGYDRKARFGIPWTGVDRNGCDTRNDILRRDLTAANLAGPCNVRSGCLRANRGPRRSHLWATNAAQAETAWRG